MFLLTFCLQPKLLLAHTKTWNRAHSFLYLQRLFVVTGSVMPPKSKSKGKKAKSKVCLAGATTSNLDEDEPPSPQDRLRGVHR